MDDSHKSVLLNEWKYIYRDYHTLNEEQINLIFSESKIIQHDYSKGMTQVMSRFFLLNQKSESEL